MLKSAVRRMIVGSSLEPLARNIVSRFSRSCAESTAELRDNPQMFAIMRRALQPDSVCIDIGANTGDMLTEMCKAAPQGRHHAVEPIPELATSLRGRFPGVTVHNVALSEAPGSATFYVVPGQLGYSGLKSNSAAGLNRESIPIEVKVETLDAIIPADCTPVLIKIDVEGAEYLALRGGRNLICRAKPLIIFEFGKSCERFNITPEMMFNLMTAEFGLRIFRMNDWLEGRAPLGRERFSRTYRQALLWNFLAAP